MAAAAGQWSRGGGGSAVAIGTDQVNRAFGAVDAMGAHRFQELPGREAAGRDGGLFHQGGQHVKRHPELDPLRHAELDPHWSGAFA
jgi:hypothetical protein